MLLYPINISIIWHRYTYFYTTIYRFIYSHIFTLYSFKDSPLDIYTIYMYILVIYNTFFRLSDFLIFFRIIFFYLFPLFKIIEIIIYKKIYLSKIKETYVFQKSDSI